MIQAGQDLDLLFELLEDAIDKVCFVDDSRITDHVLHRRWGDERVEVEIRPLMPDYPYRRDEP
jgi:Holliday junction resolvase RusA-like endonuclease